MSIEPGEHCKRDSFLQKSLKWTEFEDPNKSRVKNDTSSNKEVKFTNEAIQKLAVSKTLARKHATGRQRSPRREQKSQDTDSLMKLKSNERSGNRREDDRQSLEKFHGEGERTSERGNHKEQTSIEKGGSIVQKSNEEGNPVKQQSFEEGHLERPKPREKGMHAKPRSPDNPNKTLKTSTPEKFRRSRGIPEGEMKLSRQSGGEASKTAVNGMCHTCGVEFADGSKTICKCCLNKQLKEKPKQENIAAKKILKKKLGGVQNKLEGKENSPLTDAHIRNRSQSLDLPEGLEFNVSKYYQVPKRTRTDLGHNVQTKTELNTEFSKSSKENKKLMRGNSIMSITELSTSNTISDISNIKTIEEAKLRSAASGAAPLVSKRPTPRNPALKRSTTDSEIVHKNKTTGGGEGPKIGEDAKAAKILNFGAKNQQLDNGKKKLPTKAKRESPGTNQISQRKVPSMESVIMPSNKVSNFRMERSKTTYGKMAFDREKKEGINSSSRESSDLEVKKTSVEKPPTNPEPKTTRKFLNPNRAHTIIGDGTQKRSKPRVETSKTKLDKRENSFLNLKVEGEKKPAVKVELDKPEKKNEKKENAPKQVTPVPIRHSSRMPSLHNYSSFIDESSSDESEEESDAFPEIVSHPSFLPSSSSPELFDNASSTASEISDAKTKSSASKTSKREFRPNRQVEQLEQQYKREIPRAGGQLEKHEKQYNTREIAKLFSSIDAPPEIVKEVDSEVVEPVGPATHFGLEEQRSRYGEFVYEESDEEVVEYVDNSDVHSLHDSLSRHLGIIAEENEEEEDKEDDDSTLSSDEDELLYFEDPSTSQSLGNAVVAKQTDSECYVVGKYTSECDDDEITENSRGEVIDELALVEGNYFDQDSDFDSASPADYTCAVCEFDDNTDVTSRISNKCSQRSITAVSSPIYTELARTIQDRSMPLEIAIKEAARDLYTFGTDVDTGIAERPSDNARQDGTRFDAWGIAYDSDSESSDSSDDDEFENTCYTGGYLNDYKGSEPTGDDDLVYFNDKAGKDATDSDIYTGDLFCNVEQEGDEQRNMTKNNSTPHQNPFERRKFRNMSSRPQLPELEGCPPAGRIDWIEGQCGKDYRIIHNDLLFGFNISNNYNDYADQAQKPSTSSAGASHDRPSKTLYTEYPSKELQVMNVNNTISKKAILNSGFKDFSKYDQLHSEEVNRSERSSFDRISYLSDVLFFGDSSRRHKNDQMKGREPNIYFNTQLMSGGAKSHLDSELCCKNIGGSYDEYQGSCYETSSFDENNNSNNNADDEYSDNYTGRLKNEEEFKPGHEGLFNSKPAFFAYNKRQSEGRVTPSYFFDTKGSYYDSEESDYAFEKKVEAVKNKSSKLPQLYKIGGITVRNNVECEVDYAQNIDMDSHQAPKRWVRYDVEGDVKEEDTSSYAGNVSYEEFAGVKPWVAVETSRTPWREIRYQDNVKSKGDKSTWKAAPDKVVNSVKYVGNYVRRWF